MGIKIATFLLNPLIKKWVNKLANNLTGIIEFENYCDLNQLIEKYIFKVKKNEPIFVLIDVENQIYSEIFNGINHSFEDIKLLASGFPKELEEIKEIFKNGAKGFIDITYSELEFINAIKVLSENDFYLPQKKINELISQIVEVKNNTGINKVIISETSYTQNKITQKEKIVVEYLLKGFTYREIANLIGLTTFAVNQRTKNIYKKFGVRTRNELSYLLINK